MAFCRDGIRAALLGATALVSGLSTFSVSVAHAQARSYDFDIPPKDLGAALRAFGTTSDEQILFVEDMVRGRVSPQVKGVYTPEEALTRLLEGTGLTGRRTPNGIIMIEDERPPVKRSEADDRTRLAWLQPSELIETSALALDRPTRRIAEETVTGSSVEGLVVTAQKRRERIQDVPIAISAFSQDTLEAQKIEGGFDLLKAIPNVTFSKNNFTSYNFSIRGIGTKAVSATTDPGVSVAFNSTGLIQNRLFEQEYFDIERVEVLRGPQGTLYGRNATAGVINVISEKAKLDVFDGNIKGEVGNYHTKRLSGFINVPLIQDVLGARFAGALTQRQGYDYNTVTDAAVNGRDLWSGRLSLRFEPTERIRADFVWERFNENDDRSRTGKQLCHRDPGRTEVGGVSVIRDPNLTFDSVLRPALFSQGCLPGSLYDDAAFGTPNGLALPIVFGMAYVGNYCGVGCTTLGPMGQDENGRDVTLLEIKDPYGGMMQSRNLREIASFRDPVYRANADILELNVEYDLAEGVTLVSQTAYNDDSVYSFQDFNRFNTVPVFRDTRSLTSRFGGPSEWRDLAPGGIFCDPQLGCSNTLAGFDISQATGRQFSQELRLSSSLDGPVNFNFGANFTKFEALIDYYVFYNLITAFALSWPFNGDTGNVGPDPTKCNRAGWNGFALPGPIDINHPLAICPYVDLNPIESIDGEGHNYFRSKNPYKLHSTAAFGELYWDLNETMKITAGLRYTDDRKTFIPVPTQVLMARGIYGGGYVNRGVPALDPIEQQWGEWTGRVGLDWKPDLSFTNDTMVYAFYSRGYKGGGANPPSPGFATAAQLRQSQRELGAPEEALPTIPALVLNAKEYGRTFEPEFVNAFELGTKNSLLDGGLTINANAFYYDYSGYQVSQIRDRTAVNENFDAKIWGAELETVFAPSKSFVLIANVGRLTSEIADGERSIDIMNRTQGNPDWVVVKPWVQLPSNCVIPVGVAANYSSASRGDFYSLCGGWEGGFILPAPIDPATGAPYDFRNYPEINGGAGFFDDLGGNELPNAPHWTVNLGAQYSINLLNDTWSLTARSDAYWQSQSWARVYNSNPYDKLHGWYNVNLAVWLERPDDGLKIEFYVKNVLDDTPITDSFLNSDDTALTTNVFTLDPRLIGLSVRKEF